MYTDPIADMLTRIRNAARAGRQELVFPYSKLKESLAQLLSQEGFVGQVSSTDATIKQLKLQVKFTPEGSSVISGIKRVSKPGQRMYTPVDKIPRTNGGFGITVVSTSKGLMADREARKQRLGGEIICQVW